jgi:hypothetical protein
MRIWHYLGWGSLIVGGIVALAALVIVLRGWWVGTHTRDTGAAADGFRAQTRRVARRLGVAVSGTAVILVGAFLALPGVPGPGVLVMLIGLGILATEFVWARRWLTAVKRRSEHLADRLSGVKPTDAGTPGHQPSRIRRWLMKIKVPGEHAGPVQNGESSRK